MIVIPDILEVLSTIGNWLAGVGGTVTAVMSLYLARRDLHVTLKVSVDHEVIDNPGLKEKPTCCSIRVVNVGMRSAIITGIGWRVGFFKKKYGIQTVHDYPVSSKVPLKLDHGDEASYLVGFIKDGSYPYWIDEIRRSFLPCTPKISSRTIRVQVYTSIGKTFESKIERDLHQRLVEFALKQKK
jgi:hypothetical protein